MSKEVRSVEPDRTTEALEFSRVVDVTALQGKRTEMILEASEEECAALARRFGVERISNFKATVVLTPYSSGNKVVMKASFGADVLQACVVTLEPLTNRAQGEFVAEFVPDAFLETSGEIEFDVAQDDPPEPIIDGKIEIGELIAQNLGLEIDPFPRAPGVVFDGLRVGADDESEAPRRNPFAVLEKLKSSKG